MILLQPLLSLLYLLQQEASHGGLQELGHTLCGGVSAVGGTEGIVHVQLGIGGQLWRQNEGVV